MLRRYGLPFLTLAFFAGLVSAGWREDGKPVPDTTWRKSAGDLGVMLMLTDDPEGFFEQWNRPPAPDYKPNLSSATETHRGGQVASLVIFMGCKSDNAGNCDLDADFRLLRPDGSVYGEQKNVEVWKARPAPPQPNLQVGVGVFGIKVEEDDPFGTYVFEVKVRDRNAKIELVLTQELKVVQKA